MNISLRHLEVFVAVAKFKSIGKASEKLFLSQSAVSMALSELERRLGVKLFDRIGKKLILNNYGEIIFTEANYVLEKVNEIESIFTSKKIVGSLNIGCTQSIGNYVLPKMVGIFKKENPDVTISLLIENTENIMAKLLNFEIDLAFIEGVVNCNLVNTINWIKDEIVIFCGNSHEFANKKKVSLNDLKKAKWILREKGSGTRDIFEKVIFNKIEKINIFLEINQIEAIKQIVESGIGVGALSYYTVKREIENNSLKNLNVPFKIERDFKILIHKNKLQTPVIKNFIDFTNNNKDKICI